MLERKDLINNFPNFESLFSRDKVPKTLQTASTLWKQPVIFSDETWSRSCILHISDRDDAERVWANVRQPPKSFMSRSYGDKICESKGLHRYIDRSGGHPSKDQPWSLTPVPTLEFMVLGEDKGHYISQGTLVYNHQKLLSAVSTNTARIWESGYYGLQHELVDVAAKRFKAEVVRRMTYTDEFLRWDGRRFEPEKHHGFRYYPWLGPSVELDCWLFQQGIIRQWVTRADKSDAKQYSPHHDVFARMYGLGRNDLEFIYGNPLAQERDEQVDTVERFHTLQSMLGGEATRDIRAQFSFCSWSIRDARAAGAGVARSNNDPPRRDAAPAAAATTSTPSGRRCREQLAEARRREFKIAKILVDKVWVDVGAIPRRERTLPEQARSRNGGDWHKLSPRRKIELLGGNKGLVERFIPEYSNWA